MSRTIESCKVCGKEYLKLHSRHFYCSIACKRLANPQAKPIILPCTNCGKEASFTKGNFVRKQKSPNTIGYFCTKKCEAEYRVKSAVEIRVCEFCKVDFSCKKGERLRFCSMQCQFDWQKATRIGKNHPSYDQSFPEELRSKKCSFCGKTMKVGRKSYETKLYCSKRCMLSGMSNSMTKPHLAICKLLEEMGMAYEIEKTFHRYSFDCFLTNKNLPIEVMGTYWHRDPRNYKNDPDELQLNGIRRDGRKGKQAKDEGLNILYLWETDINSSIIVCAELIKSFYESEGILDNYHSFNYHLTDEKLVLNEVLLIPTFEM